MSTRVTDARLRIEGDGRPPGALIFFGLVVVMIAIGLGLTLYQPLSVLAIVPPALLVVNWVWKQPVRGLYMLLAATLIFEIFPLHFADSLTDRVPFFLNLNNASSSAGLSGISITPAEVLMVSVLVIWVVAGISRRTFKLEGGPLVGAYVIFALVVVGAEIHGALGRADLGKSLWEVRPQAYGLVAFLLAANLVTERQHVRNLAVVFFLAVGFKVCLTLFRYYVTLHGNTFGYEAIMAHEESYFFALFVLGMAVTLIWGRGLSRRVQLLLIAFSALSLFAMVVNQRRAAELALMAAVGVVLVLAIRFDDARRGTWLAVTLAVVVGGTAYTIAFWNHTYGLTGELVRPIHSLFQPDQRDYLSNIYRVAEDANLRVTYKTSPLVGVGFGIPMLVIFPMADISYIYPLWNYIPHNTLLWVGMRMGAVGYAAFWGLVAMAILQATRQLATSKDKLLNAVAAFAIAAIVAEIVVGYSDLQLDSYRNLIVFGVLLGLLNRLPKLAET